MNLTIETRDVAGVAVVSLHGRVVTGPEAEGLKDCVKQMVAQGKTKIVVNLANASFIDSAGAGTLVLCFTKAKAAGGDLKLASPSQAFRTVLQVTNLVKILETHDTEEDAVRTFH